MAKTKGNTVEICQRLAQPVLQELGLELWDVRFEKEGTIWYLRYFIDKDGGVTIDDCENFSRRVDKLLDEADPIDQSYCLEVSSPGVERQLTRDWHFERYLGTLVEVKTIRPVEGQREFLGQLLAYEGGAARLGFPDGSERTFPKGETVYIRLYDDYEDGGEE